MKLKFLALAVVSLASYNALAVTIDYRHEVQDTASNSQKDRLLFSHRFANGFGLSTEVKWQNGESDADTDKIYNENVSNGFEATPSYLYKFNSVLAVEGGLNLASDSSYTNYRPYIRGNIQIAKPLLFQLRYRPWYKRYSTNIGTSKETSENGYSITVDLTYKFLDKYSLIWEEEYNKTNSAYYSPIENHNSYQWTHDLKLAYAWDKNWSPYIQVGNVTGSKYTNERQTRYRVGVAYSF